MLTKCFKSSKSTLDFIALIHKNDYLEIQFHKTKGYKSIYKVPEITMEIKEKIGAPLFEYPCEVLINSITLADICKELKTFQDKRLNISVNSNTITFEVSDGLIENRITIDKDKTNGVEIINKIDFQVEFKNSYFLKMDKTIKELSIKECLLQIGPNLPLGIIFSCFNNNNNDSSSSFQFYLAPVIE
ncbi:hypothetical protein CYY_009528 [Polysphondylium violaceum]|uniref:Proliferating cell nuclear antigen n=1 Tax=Polysphondylium violaceum TaxID=133409 RepID=A0A8J4UVX9_9MYCE|nr:hypothetical protein CYY_009528 [Polysphondylium violaceum]